MAEASSGQDVLLALISRAHERGWRVHNLFERLPAEDGTPQGWQCNLTDGKGAWPYARGIGPVEALAGALAAAEAGLDWKELRRQSQPSGLLPAKTVVQTTEKSAADLGL